MWKVRIDVCGYRNAGAHMSSEGHLGEQKIVGDFYSEILKPFTAFPWTQDAGLFHFVYVFPHMVSIIKAFLK